MRWPIRSFANALSVLRRDQGDQPLVQRTTTIRKLQACVAFVLVILATVESQATLIAYDSFGISLGRGDYTPNTTLLGQDPIRGADGFVGAWGNPTTDLFLPTAGGLTHPLLPDAPAAGQLIVDASQGSAGAFGTVNLSRAIDYTPTDGAYYMSVLLRKDAATTRAELLAGLGASMPPGRGVFDVAGTWIGFIDGGIQFFSGPGAQLSRLLSSSETHVGETYMALLEYDFSTSGPDSVTASVYDSNSTRVASQVYTDLDLDDQLGRFSVLTQDYGSEPVVDEFRFGTELSDVIVPSAVQESYYYEFLGEKDIVYVEDEVVFAVLELSSVPATHQQVVRLTFTDEGRYFVSLFGNPELPEVYEGTFDMTSGLFLSDGEGGLVSSEYIEEATIVDVDTYPGYEFVLGANYAKAAFDEPEDWLGFRRAGELYCDCYGMWRQVKQPGSKKTFSDWATSQGYNPGDATPTFTLAADAQIESLQGIEDYDWNTSPTTTLDLSGNVIEYLGSGVFSDMRSLSSLHLSRNELQRIEDGAFRGLANLFELNLDENPSLTELNFTEAEFLNLVFVDVSGCDNVTRVSLRNATLNEKSLRGLFRELFPFNFGIAALDGITEIDFSGVDFSDITDLTPLYEMDELTDLWLLGVRHLDPFELDTLLDNLDLMVSTRFEGVLYMTRSEYEALNAAGGGLLEIWNNEPGHHVEFVVPEPSTVVLSVSILAMFYAGRRLVGASQRR